MRGGLAGAVEGVMTTIYRVQHRADGRGPYRPGISRLWASETGPAWPTTLDEFGLDWRNEIPAGFHCGCGFLGIDVLLKWFLPAERTKLKRLGYIIAEMDADTIIRRGAMQVIFARRMPLFREYRPIMWGHAKRIAA